MTIDQLLQNEINKLYGFENGKKTGKVLIPAFLGDFRKVLEKGSAGEIITEEYMTEDKRMHLFLKGMRRFGARGYEFVITSCVCNENELLNTELTL